MTKKKTIDQVSLKVRAKTNYETLVKSLGNDEYNERFTEQLIKELNKIHTKKETATIMASLVKGVKFQNKATFYSNYKYGVGDLGHEAWRYAEDDLHKFVVRVIFLMKLRQQRGETEIDLSSVLFYLSFFKGYLHSSEMTPMKWQNIMAARSIAAAAMCSRSNPFIIRVAHPRLVEDIKEELGLPNSLVYRTVVNHFIVAFNECYDHELTREEKGGSITYPKIEFLIPVEKNTRHNQILQLARIMNCKVTHIKRLVKDIPSLSTPSAELSVLIERLKQEKELHDTTEEIVLYAMKKVEEEGQLMSYPELKDYHRYFTVAPYTTSLAMYKRYKVQDCFVERESFLNNVFNEALKIVVDCSKYNDVDAIEPLIQCAAELLMTKERKSSVMGNKLYNGLENSKLHIELRNVKLYNTKAIEEIKKIERKISSQFLREFVINICYDVDTATSRFAMSPPTHIRVISDIHADVNRDRNYIFDFGNDLVVNCGDTASNAYEEKSWIRNFMRQGVFVAGNHLGYTSGVPELNGPENYLEFKSEIHPRNTREGQILYLMYLYHSPESVSILSNHMIKRDGLIFIGNTLYTDFKLFGEENQAACMMEAAKSMNDFRLIHTAERIDGKRKIVPFTVERHAKLFKVCKGYILNRLKALRKNHNTKPIIIVTHHCPLPYCVSDKYKNDPLSAAFASDMRDLIKEYPEIRLWCSGHTHTPYDFIYNETRFVCEPWGYFNENGFDEKNYGKRISIKDLLSKRKWRNILEKELEEGEVKDYGYCE